MKIETIVKIAVVALLSMVILSVSAAASPYTIYHDEVELDTGTFSFVPSNNASASYDVNLRTDLGALYVASDDGLEFTYNATDTWYTYYNAFYLVDINGITDDPENSMAWFIYINDELTPYGLGNNTVSDNDQVKFMYCPYSTQTWMPDEDNATYQVKIKVDFV